MSIEKKAYKLHYPSAARMLIEEGITSPARQTEMTSLQWADGLNITYTLKGLTPANFRKYADSLLLLAFQECERYKEYKWKFAGFDVKLGRLPKGKDLSEVVTFQASMHDDGEVMVYGEKALGYEVPEGMKKFLINKVDEIIDITKRYPTKINKQNPFRVIKLFIAIREPKDRSLPQTIRVEDRRADAV